jgi:menaquinone-dependent protoporphyrinogen oxidase
LSRTRAQAGIRPSTIAASGAEPLFGRSGQGLRNLHNSSTSPSVFLHFLRISFGTKYFHVREADCDEYFIYMGGERMTKLQRRQFLKAAGIGLGATTLTCAGLGYLAMQTPANDVNFYEQTGAEGNAMREKILIAYASRLGSTGEVAQAIGDQLTAGGHIVDVKRAGDVRDVAAYGSILLGSAARIGRWLPEAIGFLEQNAGALASKPVSYFTVCMTMYQDTPENRVRAQAITSAARAIREPAAEGFFAGRMDFGKISFMEQMILRAKTVPEGDYRDWDAIRKWAELLPTG